MIKGPPCPHLVSFGKKERERELRTDSFVWANELTEPVLSSALRCASGAELGSSACPGTSSLAQPLEKRPGGGGKRPVSASLTLFAGDCLSPFTEGGLSCLMTHSAQLSWACSFSLLLPVRPREEKAPLVASLGVLRHCWPLLLNPASRVF